MTSTETKVNINELITMASYKVTKGTVPPFEKLEQEFSNVWRDTYLDEDLADHVGEPCYFIYDDCNMNIRACFLGDKCDENMQADIIDNLDNVIFDLIYPDTLEQVEDQVEDEEEINNLSCNQCYEDLYNYIVEHNIDISDWEISWLKVLGLGRLDLLEEI